MKKVFLSTLFLTFSYLGFSQSYNSYPSSSYTQKQSSYSSYSSPSTQKVSGYTNSSGTYVNAYERTSRDNTNTNNWNVQGNTNPNTGENGSRARDYSSDAYNYGQGKSIQTGERGGQYYINSNGNKTYVPKRTNPY